MEQISSQNLRQKYVFNVAKANVSNNFCALIASDNRLISLSSAYFIAW
jgi:hypothetical protein